jgi:hypothetical protein
MHVLFTQRDLLLHRALHNVGADAHAPMVHVAFADMKFLFCDRDDLARLIARGVRGASRT